MTARRPASPPTTWIGETWRIAVAGVFGALFWFAGFSLAPPPVTILPLVDLIFGIAVIVSVHWRRRRPVAVGVAAVLATTVSTMAVPATVLIVASLVTSRGWRVAAVIGGLGAAAAMASAGLVPADPSDDTPWWTLLLAGVVLYGIALGVGLYVRARRELAESKRERELTAEREHASRLAEAQANERARIAREMHDVLAHRISLVAMHAGAMTYRTDLTRDQLLDSARVVQDNAHQALADLREVLGVLRDPTLGGPAEAPLRPQPTLADLPELVAEVRAADAEVTLDTTRVDVVSVPDLIGRTAYRIIQEALTNARKHAPGAAVTIRLSGHPGAQLVVEVANPMRTLAMTVPSRPTLPGAGVGLIGLQERAELAGGELTFRVSTDGTFRVHAWLPWPR